ncbi:MlaD family protein [Rufibacter tibetensis]|uniref:ABC transporter permease n=1 Tax=Rufibacter tibetensis TaxID=512763 RepID=A0A0P0C4D5_9BACT|nr:MlaD family protein [Rufibacter tibetensis]ALI99690.1 ABC transporter permease [Rufibacter tibetensis]
MSAVENRRAVVVGIFVFLALVILVAGIFVLGGQQKRFTKTIQVSAVFDDVTGLKTGNQVLFSGVRVGVVKKIAFEGPSQVAITMDITEEAQKYIRKDVKAKIGSESMIGNKAIVLYGGSPQMPVVQAGDRLATEGQLSTEAMMATFQENNKNLVAITTDFKKLSAGLANGEGLAGALLTDDQLAQNFQAILANLQRTSATSVRASQALAQFSSKLNTQGGLADELLTDTMTFNRLRATMVQLEEVMATTNQITSKLNNTTNKLGSNNNALGVLLNDEEFALDLQMTMQNLEAGTDKLDATMESLQHSILLNGFFRRKAKREARQKERELQRDQRLQKLEKNQDKKQVPATVPATRVTPDTLAPAN